MSPVTELVVLRSLLACAKSVFHGLSTARPGEGDKCCERPVPYHVDVQLDLGLRGEY